MKRATFRYALIVPFALSAGTLALAACSDSAPPQAQTSSVPKPENIEVSIDASGAIFLNGERMADSRELCRRLLEIGPPQGVDSEEHCPEFLPANR